MPFEIWKRSPLIFSLEYTLVVREFAIRSNSEERDPRERRGLPVYVQYRVLIN